MSLNLSCGRCGAIRSFSGTPPTCETCGWVYAPKPQRPATRTQFDGKNSSNGLRVLVRLAVFGGVLILGWTTFAPEPMRDKVSYGWTYSLSDENVHVSPKPKDCNWAYAPIGDKGCHYEKRISMAVTWGGKPQYVDEDSYRQSLATGAKETVTDVYVNWEKVPDQ